MPSRSRQDEQRQQKLLALLAGLFSVLDTERSRVIAGLDRFGARQKELAAGIRADNDKLRQLQADPAADGGDVNQMVQQRHMGGGGFPGPAAGLELCLRRARQDRAAVIRFGAHHPGEPAMKTAYSAACGRAIGTRTSSGRPCRAQPSVPSGYQATLCIAKRQRALRRIPRHPATCQTVEHDLPILPVAGRLSQAVLEVVLHHWRQRTVTGVGQPQAARYVVARLRPPDRRGRQSGRTRRLRQHVDEHRIMLFPEQHAPAPLRAQSRRATLPASARDSRPCGSPAARAAGSPNRRHTGAERANSGQRPIAVASWCDEFALLVQQRHAVLLQNAI